MDHTCIPCLSLSLLRWTLQVPQPSAPVSQQPVSIGAASSLHFDETNSDVYEHCLNSSESAKNPCGYFRCLPSDPALCL